MRESKRGVVHLCLEMSPRTFVIIGLGLIGGSLGAALRKRFARARVLGVSRSRRKINLAKRLGFIQNGGTSFQKVVSQADIVFVCTPVDTIGDIVEQVDQAAKPGTIVTDVGSTKGTIVRWADRKRFRNIRFVGSHPLAGSHHGGLQYSTANLFDGAVVFLTPTKKTDRRARRAIASIWKLLGTRVSEMSPNAHDRVVDHVSHLPHGVASCLVNAVSSNSLRFSASGFLDTTRVAQADPALWTPIFLTNRVHLACDLKRFRAVVDRLIDALSRGARADIRRMLAAASLKRRQIG